MKHIVFDGSFVRYVCICWISYYATWM